MGVSLTETHQKAPRIHAGDEWCCIDGFRWSFGARYDSIRSTDQSLESESPHETHEDRDLSYRIAPPGGRGASRTAARPLGGGSLSLQCLAWGSSQTSRQDAP